MDKKISGILLSAGKSERMGEMKALLPLKDKVVIEKLILEYLSASLDELIVVLGFNAKKLQPLIEGLFDSQQLRIVINEDYDKGMFSSVVKGVEATKYDDVLLGLVDQPLINKEIINTLVNAYDSNHIVIPSYKGIGGHPVIFPKFVKETILSKEFSTLKEVFDHFKDKILYVETGFEVTLDMDTKEDYEKILNYLDGGII
jgi:molybdenum cofactor cytidylyltransferase